MKRDDEIARVELRVVYQARYPGARGHEARRAIHRERGESWWRFRRRVGFLFRIFRRTRGRMTP